MRLITLSGRRFIFLVIPLLTLFLQGCDPTIYKKPLTDFREANQSMRDAYFLQLNMSDKARVENGLVQEKTSFWIKANPTLDQIEKYTNKIAKVRKRVTIGDEQTIELRKLAFRTLDIYASTLLSLASDDSTDAIVAEINNLIGDASNVVNHAKSLKKIAKLSEEAGKWIGPLSNVVGALTQVAEIVSEYVRNKAIRETIITVDEPVRDLIVLLQSEATQLQNKTIEKYGESEKTLKEKIKAFEASNNKPGATVKVPVSSFQDAAVYLEEIVSMKQELEDADDIGGIFDDALKSQSALMRKAAMPSYEDWVQSIQKFKNHAHEVKMSLEKLNAQ